MELQGKVAVVTGAASGIGRATAVALGHRGCAVALVDVAHDALEHLRAELVEDGVACSIHVVDVSNRDQMAALPQAVLAAHGAVHMLINNAGVNYVGPLASQPIEDLEWVIGVNLWGVIYGCRFFLPHLLASEEGHIVNVSSSFGLAGIPMQSVYCASKYAVRGFTESLWEELANTDVGVTLVHPASYATGIVESARGGGRVRDRLLEMQRQGRPPEHAALKIVSSIERRQKRLRLGVATFVMDWIKRASPVLGGRLISSVAIRAIGVSVDDFS